MAIRIIRKTGDPVLRTKAKAVPEVTRHIVKLLDDMRDTMYDAKGIGLAANQIGILKRVIVADVGEGLVELINPEILQRQGEQTASEGCLSIPGVRGEVKRADQIVVTALNRSGERIQIAAEGLLSRCIQHEIDHLNGILFTDYIKEPIIANEAEVKQ
ncbi:peptide deformylase [Fodinisporobacter ferrooxydans]|uniref:Peptide deformylase n=1 Tax=Fodinisporobacter ferrooxydans TaxID=2901836 RepID=A0ABY4CFR5_9BACL|nr:peptide deformylase [Alicyclobacillaceae bacterium MYW30-H2]